MKEQIELAIQHFAQGKADAKEYKLLVEWLNENPENRKVLFGMKDVWEASQIDSYELNKIERQQWMKLQEKISVGETKSIKFREILKIAALIIFALGIGWMSHNVYDTYLLKQVAKEEKTVEAVKGQIKENEDKAMERRWGKGFDVLFHLSNKAE